MTGDAIKPTVPILEKFLSGLRTAWKEGEVRPTARPKPKAIRLRCQSALSLRPAGSLLGDFRTPGGARNSSRERVGRFEAADQESGRRRRAARMTVNCSTTNAQ